MTISSETSRQDYVGNGAASQYAYGFKILLSSHLLVTVRDTSGVESTLTLNQDYTVSGAGDDAGGEITLIGSGSWLDSGNLKTDYALTIRRFLPVTQPTDIANQGPYYASLHGNAFDRMTMISLQQQDEIDRSLKLPETEAGDPDVLTLPTVEQRASKFLAFNADGEPIASDGGIDDSIPVSSFMETVLDDADAATARATIGAASAAVVAALEASIVGEVRMYAGASAPTGWLLCDGSAVSRATYADLFTLIGETFGAGDGSTTFNVPDMRGRVPIGSGAGPGLTSRSLGDKAGSEGHAHTVNSHSHSMSHRHVTPVGINPPATAYVSARLISDWGQGSERLTLHVDGVTRYAGSPQPIDFFKTRDSDTPTTGNTAPGTDSGSNVQPFLGIAFIIKT